MKGSSLVALVATLLAVSAGGCSAAEVPGEATRLAIEGSVWRWTAPMNEPRSGHAAVLLDDVRVMVLGGYNRHGEQSTSVEVYDSLKDEWSLATPLTHYRSGNTALQVGNGLVFVAGGDKPPELYDAATDSWTDVEWSGPPRVECSATLLIDGRVLLVGGSNNNGLVGVADLYDPHEHLFASVSGPAAPRLAHTATVLDGGRVLVTGGRSQTGNYECLTSAELFDPVTKTWSSLGALAESRCYATATLLKDGRVLVAGGFDERFLPGFASAELYDPKSESWQAAAPMKRKRYLHTATLLDSGLVLVAGGDGERPLKQTELYDPVTDTWSDVGPMGDVRLNHTATLLPNGEVLVAASSAEIYGPAFGDACDPRVFACPEPVGSEPVQGGAGGQAAAAGGAASVAGEADTAVAGEANTASGGAPHAAVAGGPNAAVAGEANAPVAGQANAAVAGEANAAAAGEANAAAAGEAGVVSGPTPRNEAGCTCQQAGSRLPRWPWPGLAIWFGLQRRRQRKAAK